MIYYFYSIQKGLIGLVNYRLVQNSLETDKNKLIEELKKQGKSKGYIYICRQKEGQFFNNAYKTPHPVEITGCEKLEDLL
ncbi:MAG: hypothetical protein IKY30_07755 [Oscillospiraceae bacterium]|nr:hypothetical protein [Oscillospiraceae bacterium]